MRIRIPGSVLVALATSVSLGAVACSPDLPTRPDDDLVAARPSGGGGGGGKTTTELKVSSLDPDTVPADTALVIRVLGSGFTAGSQVSWQLAGSPTTKVTTTGPVTWVSASELLAPVTVAADAPLTSYDVVVTAAGGKKGIGVEMLEVVADLILLPEPDWAAYSRASDVADDGTIVGAAGDGGSVLRALRWRPAGSGWVVEELGSGAAVGVNDMGYVLVRDSDGTTGRQSARVVTPTGAVTELGPVSVNRIGNSGTVIGGLEVDGAWVAVAIPRSGAGWGSPIALRGLDGMRPGDLLAINDRDDIVGQLRDAANNEHGAVWRFSGGGWAAPVLVDPGTSGAALALATDGTIAGAVWPCVESGGGACAPSRPAVWAAAGGARQLLADPYYDQFPGMAITGLVSDISEDHRVVGWSRVPVGRRGTEMHAAVWLAPGATDVLDLGAWQPRWSSQAHAINDAGLVVGEASLPGLARRAAAWRIP